jgi:hypothetical protein
MRLGRVVTQPFRQRRRQTMGRPSSRRHAVSRRQEAVLMLGALRLVSLAGAGLLRQGTAPHAP